LTFVCPAADISTLPAIGAGAPGGLGSEVPVQVIKIESPSRITAIPAALHFVAVAIMDTSAVVITDPGTNPAALPPEKVNIKGDLNVP